MSFLAPWFVAAGVAAVALPVLFHLLRRTPRGRVPFSTLMFLTPSPPRLTSRSRLENWPLLLLRAAVLVLLALAFGRPFLRQLLEQKQSTPAGRRTVVLVDAGASMRRGDLWQRAVAAAQQAFDRAEPHDETALAVFASEVQTPVPFGVWRETPVGERSGLARAALNGLQPTWNGTRLDAALVAAVEMLDAADADRKSSDVERVRRIVLISDLKRGSHLAGLQGFEWPKNVPVEVVALTQTTANAGLHAPEMTDAAANEPVTTAKPRVLVTNAADSRRESFELDWESESVVRGPSPVVKSRSEQITTDNGPRTTDEIKQTTGDQPPSVPVYVPPGQTRVVRVSAPPAGEVRRLVLRGDDEPFDNVLWSVPPPRETLRVLHLANEKPDDPQSLRYFLERAFAAPLGGSTVTVETLDTHAAEIRSPTERDLEAVPLIVVAQSAPLPEAWRESLAAWLDRGGVAVAPLLQAGDAAWRSLIPDALGIRESIVVVEAELPQQYVLLGEIDFRHPLFQPLADPRFSDFTKVRFQHYRKLTLDADMAKTVRVVARFDSGDPAIVEVPRGQGRLFLFAAGWQPRESGLGVSSKFVPLVQTLAELGRGRPAMFASYETGATVDLRNLTVLAPGEPPGAKGTATASRAGTADAQSPSPPAPLPVPGRGEPNTADARSVGPWTVRLPDGAEQTVAADSPRFTFAAGPGVYEVRSAAGTQRFAVNLPPDESRTAPLGVEALETVGVKLWRETAAPSPDELVAETRSLQRRELESRQQLWRWCLTAALGIVIVETWYAGRIARREDATPDRNGPNT
jgi:hypothetical protein